MSDLKAYAVFAETVASGSMSAAARRLGMTPSAVSQIISGLERQTGVALLHRSTRKLSLTEAGERCYPHCLRLLEAGNAAANSLEQARDAPIGELRIAAPVGFGAHIAPALAPLLAEWPQLRLRLIADDELINLIDARIDIALRVGWLPEAGWIGRKLCDFEMILCASASYLERHGIPNEPSDLVHHHWLALMREASDITKVGLSAIDPAAPFSLDLHDRKERHERVEVPVRITTTNQIALQQMCEQGMGIARLFYADARPALERGVMTRVMPQWQLLSLPVMMVTARRKGQTAKVRVALAALERYFSTVPGGTQLSITIG